MPRGRSAGVAVAVVVVGSALLGACSAAPDLVSSPPAAAPPVSTTALAPTTSAPATTEAPTTTVAPATTTATPTAPAPTTAASTTTTTVAPTTTAAPTTVAPTTTAAPVTTVTAGPDPAAVGANELGSVPVLMYHQIVASPASVYDRTPADFRAELERLAAEGYVPITAAELTAGDFSAVPAGKHPVVLTFDDSTPSQFALGPDGAPKAGTATAILFEVAAASPGFRPVATFYVNRNPFGDRGGTTTLPWLVANGFEIGNHTRDHKSLSDASAAEAMEQIASMQASIEAAVPGYAVTTMALPFGARPDDLTLALTGSSSGVTYAHTGVMHVGANPTTSPFAATFKPTVVARIRSQGPNGPDAEVCSAIWLDKLAANPASRFTSDGDPNVISFPASSAGELHPDRTGQARPY